MDIINDIIYPVLEDIKEEEELDFELSEDLELYSKHSVFDSLSLVRFIVNIQDKILEITDKDISLVNSDIMSKANSPFKTVKTFSKYVEELISNA